MNERTSNLIKIEQLRAKSAWNSVKNWKKKNEGKHRTWAINLPALILHNGLLPTLAFLNAKKAEQAAVGKACALWLMKPNGGAQIIPWGEHETDENGTKKLINWLLHEDSNVHRIAEAEALEWATWLKRFAEGYLEKEDGKQNASSA